MRQSLIRLLFALLVLCSPAVAQTQISTNIADNGDLKVVYADFPAKDAEGAGPIHAAIITLQVVSQYQCVASPGNPPVGSIRVYCDAATGNLTCINSSGGNCGGGGGSGFVFGTGTPPDLAVWSNSTTLANSAASDNGTTLTYHGTGGISTPSAAFTGPAPFGVSAIEGASASCVPVAAGQDALCSVSDLSPAGLWYSANGASYVPLFLGPVLNNQLISGGGVTWTGLLNFTVSAASYAIVSTNYTSVQTNVTLSAADATNPRIDSIIVDNTGTVSVVTGTPAGSPVAPVIDPTTQLQLVTVRVAANATTPTLNNILVYDENVGTPTEWNCTASSNFNCASTTNPFHSTHDIEATTAVATNNAVLAFSSTVDLSTYSTLSLNIRNKALWPAAKSVSICFLNSTVIVGNCVGLKDGIFGFTQSNVSSYQQIVVPLSAFALTGVVDRVRFQVAGSGSAIGFYLDWIQIQSALTGAGSGGNFQLQVNGETTALASNLADSATVTWAQTTTNGVSTIKATASGAGAVNFSQITSGTNTTAAMVLGTGSSFTDSIAPTASHSAMLFNGALLTGGTGTTNFPHFYINQGASAPTTWSTSGTLIGLNAPSGFTGNLLDTYINGTQVTYLTSGGAFTSVGSIAAGAAGQIGINARSGFRSAANGRAQINNNTNLTNGLTRLTFGTEATLNPAFCFDGSTAIINTCDGAGTTANGIFQSNTVNIGSAGVLGSLVFGNATSGLVTVQPPTGAITSYTLDFPPVAQPAGGNTFLSCTAANPSVCTFAGGAAAYNTIDNNGSALTQRSTLNFIPSGAVSVSCVDNSGATRTDCTIGSGSLAPFSPQTPAADTLTNASLTSEQFFATTIAIPANTITTNTELTFNMGGDYVGTGTPANGTLRIRLCTTGLPTPSGCVIVFQSGSVAPGVNTRSAWIPLHIIGTTTPGSSANVVALAGNGQSTLIWGTDVKGTSIIAMHTSGILYLVYSIQYANTTASSSLQLTALWADAGPLK